MTNSEPEFLERPKLDVCKQEPSRRQGVEKPEMRKEEWKDTRGLTMAMLTECWTLRHSDGQLPVTQEPLPGRVLFCMNPTSHFPIDTMNRHVSFPMHSAEMEAQGFMSFVQVICLINGRRRPYVSDTVDDGSRKEPGTGDWRCRSRLNTTSESFAHCCASWWLFHRMQRGPNALVLTEQSWKPGVGSCSCLRWE